MRTSGGWSGGGGKNEMIMDLEWSCRKCLWRWSEGGGRNFGF